MKNHLLDLVKYTFFVYFKFHLRFGAIIVDNLLLIRARFLGCFPHTLHYFPYSTCVVSHSVNASFCLRLVAAILNFLSLLGLQFKILFPARLTWNGGRPLGWWRGGGTDIHYDQFFSFCFPLTIVGFTLSSPRTGICIRIP